MALCLNYFYCLGLHLLVFVPGIVFGEIDDVYKFLSWRVDDVLNEMKQLKIKVDNIDSRVKQVEENLQGLHTTTPNLIDHRTEDEVQELETRVNENLQMQTLAIERMLSKEKVLLRKSVENVTAAFAELKFNIQTQMSVFNASFKDELEIIETNFDNLKFEVRSEMVEYNQTLSEGISDINAILDTNFKNMYEMDNTNSMLLMKGIAELTSDWNSTIHNISQMLQTMEGKMVSNIEQIDKRMKADVKREQNETLQSISTLDADVQSLSTNMSTFMFILSNRISSESSSLSSRISSISSTLSSETTSLSSRISALSSSLSSHSNRIYLLEERVDKCSSYPCLNNATCMDGINSYSCTCLPGYSGTNCEIVGCKLPHNAAPVKHPKPYYTIGETIPASHFECDLSSTAVQDHGMTCLEGGLWTKAVTCKTISDCFPHVPNFYPFARNVGRNDGFFIGSGINMTETKCKMECLHLRDKTCKSVFHIKDSTDVRKNICYGFEDDKRDPHFYRKYELPLSGYFYRTCDSG